MARAPNLKITSDDVNALVYSYLEDAGFQHTSYALRHEARLDSSPNLNVRIPRGELIKLLHKALLYSEAEAHFRRDGANSNDQCTAPFSILKTHHCSQGGPPSLPSPPEVARNRPELFPPPRPGSPAISSSGEKRKASAKAEARADKRAKTAEASEEIVALRHAPDLSDTRDITAIDWDRTGARIATGSYDGIIRVWTAEGTHLFNLSFHQGAVFAAKWSPCASWLLSASLDGTIVIWNMLTLKPDKIEQLLRVHNGDQHPIKTFLGHEDEVNIMRLSQDRTSLASSSDDRTVRVWDLAAWQAAGVDGLVRAPKGQPDPYQKCVLRGHVREVCSLGWCPNENARQHLLVTTAFDNTSRIWDTRDGSCVRELLTHRDKVYTHSFSSRGRYLATGSADGRVLVYDMASGAVLFEWDCQQGGVFELEWQKTGDQLGVCLENRGVAILDMKRLGLGDYVEPPLPGPKTKVV
ncbi:hypothetical protein FRB97_006864 [Tulasnella sp. 331]|nr:hypothetical protein FRB97_006864 [Tulasnella sp. 331]